MRTSLLVARLLWMLPLVLLYLAVNQAIVARDLQETFEAGAPATAEITELEISNRVDVTLDWVSLVVRNEDGSVQAYDQIPLPHTLAPMLEDTDEVAVRLRPGTAQPLVIERIARAQWRMAAIQAAIAFFGALLFGGGVFWWNRTLKRQGDPAQRTPAS